MIPLKLFTLLALCLVAGASRDIIEVFSASDKRILMQFARDGAVHINIWDKDEVMHAKSAFADVDSNHFHSLKSQFDNVTYHGNFEKLVALQKLQTINSQYLFSDIFRYNYEGYQQLYMIETEIKRYARENPSFVCLSCTVHNF